MKGKTKWDNRQLANFQELQFFNSVLGFELATYVAGQFLRLQHLRQHNIPSAIRDPEWPSGLVARSPRRRPGFDSRSVGLSEINFSDLYCGCLVLYCIVFEHLL